MFTPLPWFSNHICNWKTFYTAGRTPFYTRADQSEWELLFLSKSKHFPICIIALGPWTHKDSKTRFLSGSHLHSRQIITGDRLSYIKNLRTFLANRNTKHTQGSRSHWIIYPRTHDAGLQRFLLNLFSALGNFIAVLWIYVGPEAGPWQLFAAMIWIVSLRRLKLISAYPGSWPLCRTTRTEVIYLSLKSRGIQTMLQATNTEVWWVLESIEDYCVLYGHIDAMWEQTLLFREPIQSPTN